MNSELVVPRDLKVQLPSKQSAFLWGARQTGKTMFLRQHFPHSLRFDFLESDTFFDFSKHPALLRERLLAESDRKKLTAPIILDEVQKVPALLDEVHWLIENKGFRFILCGSSARKLKRGHANLLGGRAWRYELFPLTRHELGKEFQLLNALNHGLLPVHYRSPFYRKGLKAYIQNYLKEEIMAEGLSRNIPAFSRFLDIMAYGHGELTNFSNIARDCGVDSKTIREYYQILEDTLVGYFVWPFSKRTGRDIINSAPKFYLFDVGVAGYLANRVLLDCKGAEFGKAFEHFILMELMAFRAYRERDFEIQYWRTKTGHEVDFVLDKGKIAIEIKGSVSVSNMELKGLRAFQVDHKPQKSILVYQGSHHRKVDDIDVMPYEKFLDHLWEDKIL